MTVKNKKRDRDLETALIKVAVGIVATLFIIKFLSAYLATAATLLMFVGAWHWTRKMAAFDPADIPFPAVRQVRMIEAVWLSAFAAGLLLIPHGGSVYHAVGGAVVTAALLAVVHKMGERHLRWQPTATWFGLVCDAWGRLPVRKRALALAGTVALGGALTMVTWLGPMLGLLAALCVGRLNWEGAKADGETRLHAEGLLSGLKFKDKNWTEAHKQNDRAPILSLDLNEDGVPEKIVIPVPNDVEATAQPALEDAIIARLQPIAAGGTYAVQWLPEGKRIAVIQWWPPLPDIVYYDGRAAEDRKVWLGKGIVNREMLKDEPNAVVGSVRDVHLDFAVMPHALIVGGTGGGKTITGKSLMLQWTLGGNLLCIGDPKRVDYSVFRGARGVIGFETEPTAIAEMAKKVQDQMAYRFALMEQHGVNIYSALPEDVRPQPLLLAIDEATQAMTLEKGAKGDEELEAANAAAQAVRSAVSAITRLGRAAGVHVVLLTQRPDAEVIAGNTKANLEARFLLGASADAIARQMAGFARSEVCATPGKRGRGIFGQNDGVPIEVQFAFAPEEALDDLIAGLKDESPAVRYGDAGVSVLDAYASARSDVQRREVLVAALAAGDLTDEDARAVGFASLAEATDLLAAYEATRAKIDAEQSDLAAIEAVTRNNATPPAPPAPVAPAAPAAPAGGDTTDGAPANRGNTNQPETPTFADKRFEPLPAGQADRDLEALIGLVATKAQIASLRAQIEIAIERAKIGVGSGGVAAPHLIIKGPPGTGKTTVARLIGSILREMGVLPSGHLIDLTPKDIVAGYVGQSAPLAAAACAAAMGGVLFIDEAYQLREGIDAYTDQARNELMVWAENHRGQFVIILAGYTDEMETMLDANPGLRSRFPTHIDCPSYSHAELVQIAESMVANHKEGGWLLGDGAHDALMAVLGRQDVNARHWGNARDVRVLVDKAVEAASLRLSAARSAGVHVTKADLVTMTPADILAADPTPAAVDSAPSGGMDDPFANWLNDVPA